MWDRIRYLAKYLAMPVPRYLRDMGYVRGLKRLDARGRRCEAAWEPHVAHSQSLILEAADRCGQSGKALVLGSGPLFDVPVEELSERFREVVLVDLLHLWRARSEVRRYPNVRLECMDVTGVLKEAHALARIGQALEGAQRTPDFFLEDGFDLIVSANILSQLPLAPVRYASRKRNRAEPWRVRAFSRRLAIDHLNWLASFTGHVCLISDLERLFCDGEDIVSRGESLWGVALPEGGQEWMWELGPKPEIDPRHDVRHRVVGYAEFPKGVWLGRDGPRQSSS